LAKSHLEVSEGEAWDHEGREEDAIHPQPEVDVDHKLAVNGEN
jgi:hypothetical protein